MQEEEEYSSFSNQIPSNVNDVDDALNLNNESKVKSISNEKWMKELNSQKIISSLDSLDSKINTKIDELRATKVYMIEFIDSLKKIYCISHCPGF